FWFYFVAKSLLPQNFAETRLQGWLKNILVAIHNGRSWIDQFLFVVVSICTFAIFPLLLVAQLDVFQVGPAAQNLSLIADTHQSQWSINSLFWVHTKPMSSVG